MGEGAVGFGGWEWRGQRVEGGGECTLIYNSTAGPLNFKSSSNRSMGAGFKHINGQKERYFNTTI